MSTDGHDFGRLEFSGGRFEGTGMPIAALLELRRFEVLIEEVAVALYKREHPGRERTARGFRASFDLRVTEFRQGCVEAVLTRPQADDTVLDVTANDYFDRSREMVYQEMRSFTRTRGFTHLFPVEARPRLAALGRGLRASESVGYRASEHQDWARLDSALRDILSEVVSDAPSNVDTVILGQVTGLESSPHHLSLFLSDEQRTIKGRFSQRSMWDELHHLTGYQQRAPLVTLSANVRVTQTGEPEFLEEIFNVEAALPETLAAQIRRLSELDDGWYDGQGNGISGHIVDRVERLAEIIGTSEHNNVSIFPRLDGGVQFEWADEDFELDILPDGTEVAYAFADERDEDGERTFTSNDAPRRVISWLYGEDNV